MTTRDTRRKENMVRALYLPLGKDRVEEFRKKCIQENPEWEQFFQEFDRRNPGIFQQ
jgi:hypothetical protein